MDVLTWLKTQVNILIAFFCHFRCQQWESRSLQGKNDTLQKTKLDNSMLTWKMRYSFRHLFFLGLCEVLLVRETPKDENVFVNRSCFSWTVLDFGSESIFLTSWSRLTCFMNVDFFFKVNSTLWFNWTEATPYTYHYLVILTVVTIVPMTYSSVKLEWRTDKEKKS